MKQKSEPMNLVDELRKRACPAGESWTGDDPVSDHGHTDCWLHQQSANMIEDLEKQLEASRKICESYRIRLINIANGETSANIFAK
jgi:hypothetical protein